MDEVVIEDLLGGVLLYAIEKTNNLKKEKEVREVREYAKQFDLKKYGHLTLIPGYTANGIFDDAIIRPGFTVVKRSGTIIDVIKADILEMKRDINTSGTVNVVIPFNTAFDTKFEEKIGEKTYPIVSINTLHGEWLEYVTEKRLRMNEIDVKIAASLKHNGFKKCATRICPVGKQDVFPIASLAVVKVDKMNFYLVAISDFDEKNKACSNREHVEKSILSVLDFYDANGQGDDLYIPLIGSGRSRSGMTAKESYDLIVGILKERQNAIYGRVHVVIHPTQYDEINNSDQ
ncbi:MAG: DUF6430 domain-containing protein [Lachnospiraceae bacterium]|nr:DUF6430 domain-containing protein [Lachnospiraceae bacterium]